MSNKRFRREDWLDFGLTQLGEAGPDALRLTELCAAAGRTIGSFYHHFQDQAVFFEALMAHWRQKNALDVIAEIEAIPDAQKQAEKLDVIAASMNQAAEIGVRHFANQNAMAAGVVAEVDQMRIGYLAELNARRLALEAEEALSLAELEYAAFVGTQMIWKGESLAHGKGLSDLFQRLVASHYSKSS